MAKSSCCIPTIDLSPFFSSIQSAANERRKQEVLETITRACSEYGFFQIVNHGVPVDLMTHALHLSKTFFDSPDEEKLRSSPNAGAPLPAGYNRQPDHSPDKNEYLLVFPPGSPFNIYPENPPELREVIEEIFSNMCQIGHLLESILNDCLGLPPDFLQTYNDDRSWDFMAALRYFPATETENTGILAHEDANCITLVFQDNVGGLEVFKDGAWIPVVPHQGNIVVNVGDVLQVLSNEKLKSGKHRVVRAKGGSRYSYAFFYNLQGDKRVEPLPHFTKHIGETPKYKGFVYKEYQALRMRNKTHPPSTPAHVIDIAHYSIPS